MRKILVLCFSLLFGFGQLFAQPTRSLGDKNYFGFEAGLNYSGYMGGENFFISFSNPFMSDPNSLGHIPLAGQGSGIGFQLGGTVDLNLAHNLAFMGKVSFRNHSTSYEDQVAGTCPDVITGIPGDAVFANSFDASYNVFGADLLLRYQFNPDAFYGIIGFGLSNMLSNSVSLSQEIVSSTNDCSYLGDFGVPTGETQLVVADDDEMKDFFEAFSFGPKIGIGTFIPVGTSGTVITPELALQIPLSEWLNKKTTSAMDAYAVSAGMPDPTAPKMWFASLTVGVKFPWGDITPRKSRANEKETTLAGHVRDRKTNLPIGNARITIVDLATNEDVDAQSTDASGAYGIILYPGRYSVTAEADGYLFNSTYFEVNDAGQIVKGNPDIYLDRPPAKTRLLVFFDFNKDELKDESTPELRRAVRFMQNNSSMEVEIAGHTDNVGSDQYNKELSQRRANAVLNYLTQNGISTSRLAAIGYGETQPIDSNDTDEGRATNRRVEFVVKKL